MALSFAASRYTLNAVQDISKHRNKKNSKIRSLPSSSSSSSSLQASYLPKISDNETTNSSEHRKISSSLSPPPYHSHENTVGIIGGVSVLSTLIFLEKFVLWSSREKAATVPFIVYSDPTMPSTSNSISDKNGSGISSGLARIRMVENLKSKRMFLEEGGARCIVMPCHLSHAYYGEISQGSKQPFLHVADCVAMELKEARLRPIEAGSGVKVGVVATDEILMAGFYQEKLQEQGFEVVLPDKSTIENIINPAINSLKRKDMKGACNLLRIAIQILLVKSVNTVILASHELQCLLPYDDPLVKKCIDPMDSLARSAIRWAKSGKIDEEF